MMTWPAKRTSPRLGYVVSKSRVCTTQLNASGQVEDLKCFGKLLLVLSHRSVLALQNIPKALDHVGYAYSIEFRNLIATLLDSKSSEVQATHLTINDICQSISDRILAHLDRVQR